MKDYATLVLVKYAGSFTLRRVILCLRVVIEYGAGLDFFRGKSDLKATSCAADSTDPATW